MRTRPHPLTGERPAAVSRSAPADGAACHDVRVTEHAGGSVQRPRRGRPFEVVAHRGASGEAPEHTLAAYRRAIEEGADSLECDVRLTADGHLVCVHDRRVDRTSDGRGAVSALELAELAALDFGSWKAGSPDAARLPGGELTSVLTLERLLELVAHTPRPVGLAIETKHPTRWAGQVEERLLVLLRRYRELPGLRVMSFSARSLERVRAGAPWVPTAYLMQWLLPRHRDGSLPPGVSIAGPHVRVLWSHPEYVARAHRAGHRVHVWTVDEPDDVELCVRLGVDAVITNRPSRVCAQLE